MTTDRGNSRSRPYRVIVFVTAAVCGLAAPALGQAVSGDTSDDASVARAGAAIDSTAPAALRLVEAVAVCEGDPRDSSLRTDVTFWQYATIPFDRRTLDRARECLARLVVLEPRLPWAWYGLGLVRLELSRIGTIARPGPLQPIGLDYARGAERAFERVLELDPAYRDAVLMIPVALGREHYWDQFDEANRALRRTAAGAASKDLAVLLVRLRLERQQRERDSALALARRYLEAGGDPGIGSLELAQELFVRGDSVDGAAAYWDGARQAGSDSARARYRLNIAWTADSAELAAYDSLPADSIAPWLRRFWARRDAQSARPPGARLVEHFRRLEYAGEHFVVRARRARTAASTDVLTPGAETSVAAFADSAGAGWDNALTGWLFGGSLLASRTARILANAAPGESWLDARGPMYLRHGPPDKRAGKWWLYRRGGRDLMVEVVPLQDRFPGDQCNLIASYCIPLPRHGQRRRLERERHELEMAAIAVSSDGYPLLFDRPLYPVTQLFALHQQPGAPGGRLLVVFALRGNRLEPERVDTITGRATYPLTMRIVAADPAGTRRFDVDTLRTFLTPAPLENDEYLTGSLEVPLPAGAYDVRVVLETPDSAFAAEYEWPNGATGRLAGRRGAVVALDSMIVPTASTDSLTLSDVVLGRRGSGLTWWSGSARVSLNPLNTFPEGGTAEMYYEVAGLTPGAEYRTEITIRPRRRNDEAAARADEPEPLVTLGFVERATDTRAGTLRQLGLERLKEGSYEVEVAIRTAMRDGAPHVARRVTTLNVVD